MNLALLSDILLLNCFSLEIGSAEGSPGRSITIEQQISVMPSRRTLARQLEAVTDFDDPTASLEQYLTPAELAAHIIHLAALRGDIDDQPVIDLGTGTGMLAIGATLAGSARVLGVDIDPNALARARENERRIAPESSIDWVRADATRAPLSVSEATVLANPPFGAQHGHRHADRAFLETTAAIGNVSYTIHNSGSLDFLESFAADADGAITDAFHSTIDLEHRFPFHEDPSRELEIEVVRIEWK